MRNKLFLAIMTAVTLLTSAVQAGDWNAYAIDSQGRYGYAYGYDSQGDAKYNALNGCGIAGCKIIMSVQSQCMAFADTHQNGYWYGYAYATNLQTAKTLALGNCAESGQGGCKVQHAQCV